MKTEGAVAERARGQAKMLLLAVLVFMGVVSLWTPLAFERIAARWFSTPNIYFLWPVPVLTAVTALMVWRWLAAGREVLPFLASIALFLLGYLGLVISTFPYLVPPTLDGLADRGGAGEPDVHAGRHALRCCRSSSATSCSSTGCSAGKCARARAITDRRTEDRWGQPGYLPCILLRKRSRRHPAHVQIARRATGPFRMSA